MCHYILIVTRINKFGLRNFAGDEEKVKIFLKQIGGKPDNDISSILRIITN